MNHPPCRPRRKSGWTTTRRIHRTTRTISPSSPRDDRLMVVVEPSNTVRLERHHQRRRCEPTTTTTTNHLPCSQWMKRHFMPGLKNWIKKERHTSKINRYVDDAAAAAAVCAGNCRHWPLVVHVIETNTESLFLVDSSHLVVDFFLPLSFHGLLYGLCVAAMCPSFSMVF
jgi:hypothetical protein